MSRDGSIDWLCWPRFDAPSLFASILDPARGGYFRIAPVGEYRVHRRYVGETNVLETRFFQENGELVLYDFMPVWSERTRRTQLMPENELIRIARCARGEVKLALHFEPRPLFGTRDPRLRDRGKFGWEVPLHKGIANLRASIPLLPLPGDGVHGEATLRTGESIDASLIYARDAAVLPPLGERSQRAFDETTRFWSSWARRTRYHGPHRDAVVRSALVLKALVFAPSGAIVAAPTTSLPEQLGGDLNWDYRFCWLRDASLTARALFGLGHHDEANSFLAWTLHATRLTRPQLNVLYDVYGRDPHQERDIPELAGYKGARPVRVGNLAHTQLQLDVYGEVVDAAAWFARHGGTFDRETASMLEDFGRYVHEHWDEPDEGIWEVRGGRRRFTHSRVLCWTALDRLLALHDAGLLTLDDRAAHVRVAQALKEEIESRGFNESLGSYTQQLDGKTLDASLLLLPHYGYRRASSPRMAGTVRAIRQHLGAGGPLVKRYGGVTEGAFGVCSYWLIECLALGAAPPGEADDAFRAMQGYANDLGLFAEEIDPRDGKALGNFPQAFTHIGLINAALTLEEVATHPRPHERRVSMPARTPEHQPWA